MSFQNYFVGGPRDGGTNPITDRTSFPKLLAEQTTEAGLERIAIYEFHHTEDHADGVIRRIYRYQLTLGHNDGLDYIDKHDATLGG